MKTVFLLMAQYDARAVIPIEWVARDFFSHLTADNLVRKISAGDIALPLVRMEDSARSAKGVALIDLADYIDQRIEAARKECRQFLGHG
ncbi:MULTISPECIES: pyocin activator PrtN family protein [Methylorubrum]|jgi:Pyocin activator protein PrtN|uniref:pyocin activator PrtN family protein n=1 Tax=Methylorubrum TaxID=2282523 RepID=UPI00365EA6BD